MDQYNISLAIDKIYGKIDEQPREVGQEYERTVMVQVPKQYGNAWLHSPENVTFRAVVVEDKNKKLRWDIVSVKKIDGEELI